MQVRTRQLVVAGVALVLIAGAIRAVSWGREPPPGPQARKAAQPASPGRGKDRPKIAYWHVWTDEHGVSHQKRSELSDFEFQSISEGAAPSWIDRLNTPAANLVVLALPVGWVGEWHENPKPQWIVPLSGRWFVETMMAKG
jgi:hypothetical protein